MRGVKQLDNDIDDTVISTVRGKVLSLDRSSDYWKEKNRILLA
jgi:hypothetical protein